MYAFTGWVASAAVFTCWLAWTWAPGAYFAAKLPLLPDRYWALAVPAWCTTAFACTSLLYIAVNLMATAPLDSFNVITSADGREGIISVRRRSRRRRRIVPDFRDIDIVTANRLMYVAGAAD